MKKSSRKTKRKGTVAVKVIAPKFENGGGPGDRLMASPVQKYPYPTFSQPSTPEDWGKYIHEQEMYFGNPRTWSMEDYILAQERLNQYKYWRENTPEGRAVIDRKSSPNEYVIPLPIQLDEELNAQIDRAIQENPELQFIPRQKFQVNPSQPNPLQQFLTGDVNSYANGGISFDFDDTLSTDLGLDLAKSIPSSDKYIISARPQVTPDMIQRAKQAGIPKNRIFAMGSDEAKVAKIQELGINRHIDNKQSVIDRLGFKGQLFANGGTTQNTCPPGYVWNGLECVINILDKSPSSTSAVYMNQSGNYTLNPIYDEYARQKLSVQESNRKAQDFNKEYVQSKNYKRLLKKQGYSPEEIENRINAVSNINDFTYTDKGMSYVGFRDDNNPSSEFIQYNVTDPGDWPGFDQIAAHEWGHVGVDSGFIPLKEKERKEFINRINQDNAGVTGNPDDFIHDMEPQENRADLTQLRQQFQESGLFDSTKRKKFTAKDLQKYKKQMESSEDNWNNMWNRMFRLYDDKDIIWFMNNVAQNDSNEDMQVARYGGMYNPYQNLFANGGEQDEPPGRFFNWIKNLRRPKDELKGYTAGPIFDTTTELGFKRQQLLNQSLGRPEIQADPWDQQRWLMEQNMADEEAGLYEAPTLPQEKVEPMPVYNAVEQLDFGPEFSQETKTELKSLYDQKLWQEKLNQRAIDFKKKNKFDKLDPLISLPLTDYEERLKADSKYENELKKQGYFINKNQTTGTVELFPANEIYTRIWNSGLRTDDIINKLGVGTKENVENYFGDFMGQADQYHEYQTKKAVLDLMEKGYSLDNAVNYLANVKKLGTKEDLYNSYGKDFKDLETYAKSYVAYSDDYVKPYKEGYDVDLRNRWTDNDIITLAKDREFIDNYGANIEIASPLGSGRQEWGAQIQRAIRSGKWGWKPKSNELVKLASDDAYKGLIVEPSQIDLALINNLKDYQSLEPQDYNRKYSPTIAQDEEDWKKGKVAVQISETDEWRPNKMYVGGDEDGWGGQYYQYQFEVPAGKDPITGEQLTKLVTPDEMAGQTVYMTQEEADKYEKAMLADNMQDFQGSFFYNLPGIIATGAMAGPGLIGLGENLGLKATAFLGKEVAPKYIPGLTVGNLLEADMLYNTIKPGGYAQEAYEGFSEGDVSKGIENAVYGALGVLPFGAGAATNIAKLASTVSEMRPANTVRLLNQSAIDDVSRSLGLVDDAGKPISLNTITDESNFMGRLNTLKAYQEKGLIAPETNLDIVAESPNLYETVTKAAIKRATTVERSVNADAIASGVAESSRGTVTNLDAQDLAAIQELGLTAPEDIAFYAGTTIPYGKYGDVVGLQGIDRNLRGLYHYRQGQNKFGGVDLQYGPYTVQSRYPLDLETGTARTWLERYGELPIKEFKSGYGDSSLGYGDIFSQGTEAAVIGKSGETVLKPIKVNYASEYTANMNKIKEEASFTNTIYGSYKSGNTQAGETLVEMANSVGATNITNADDAHKFLSDLYFNRGLELQRNPGVKTKYFEAFGEKAPFSPRTQKTSGTETLNTSNLTDIPSSNLTEETTKTIRGVLDTISKPVKEVKRIINSYSHIKDTPKLYKDEISKLFTPEGISRLKELGVDDIDDFMNHMDKAVATSSRFKTTHATLKGRRSNLKPSINMNYKEIEKVLKSGKLGSKGSSITEEEIRSIMAHEIGHNIQNYLLLKGKASIFSYPRSKLDAKIVNELEPFFRQNVKDYLKKSIGLSEKEALELRKAMVSENRELSNVDYFLKGSEGLEPLAHLRELKQDMVNKGVINSIYDEITMQDIHNFYTYHGGFSDRVLSFIKPSEEAFKTVAKLLNKTPGVVPYVIGAGAAGAAGSQMTDDNKKMYGGTQRNKYIGLFR